MRILLAIDESSASDAAIEEVCRRPWPPETEVRILTVLSPLEYVQYNSALKRPTPPDSIFKQKGWAAARRLKEAAAALEQRAPGLRVYPVLLEGHPKEVILDEAESWGADLIVVGSHGNAIRRFFLGSVSLAVALNAHCSVAIIRVPQKAA